MYALVRTPREAIACPSSGPEKEVFHSELLQVFAQRGKKAKRKQLDFNREPAAAAARMSYSPSRLCRRKTSSPSSPRLVTARRGASSGRRTRVRESAHEW